MQKINRYLLVLFLFSNFLLKPYCPFCDPKVINRQKYAETALVFGLYNYKPAVPGHCLVVPKRHIERFNELNDGEWKAIFNMILDTDFAVRRVFGTDDYYIEQNNGVSVGQSVPHIHFHYVPNHKGNSPIWFQLRIFLYYPFRRELSDQAIKKVIDELKEVLASKS